MPKIKNELTDFGKWVKKCLVDQGMTVRELSKETGYLSTTISKVLYGERPGYKCKEDIIKYFESLDTYQAS